MKVTTIRAINYLLIFILCVSITCHREDQFNHCFIHFSNKANFGIYVCSKSLISRQDTIAEYRFGLPLKDLIINPYEINSKSLESYSWESVFSDNRASSIDTLMIFVFDAEKVEAEAEPQEAVIARYDVSLEDLQSNNWMLSYPPNDNMANIKMWPPFSSYHQ